MAALLAIGALCGRAIAQPTMHLNADRIAFYYDRFLVEADGNVRIELDNGITVKGQSFSMDLKSNRFLIAGSVNVTSPSGSQSGAALADFLDFKRVYFVPITSEPDRWTFLNDDFAHPAKGREMPGDTFFFPNLSGDKPFISARTAVISPQNFVRFGSSQVDIGLGKLPVPSFYVNFASNPDLKQNSLTGANYDATYNFTGNANAISAVHLRYDPVNKLFLAIEQHVASRNGYAVFSVNPLTKKSKFFNLVTAYRFSSNLQFRSFSQLHTFQAGLSSPLESSHFSNLQLTAALKQSYIQLNTQLVNQSLLDKPGNGRFIGDPSHTWNPDHPSYAQLGITGFDHRIAHLPIYSRIRYGLGFSHDNSGSDVPTAQGGGILQTLGGVPYTTIWNHYVGITLYSPSIKLGKSANPYKVLYLNAIADKQRTWNSSPHYIDQTNTTVSVSKIFSTHLAAYTAYNVNNIKDVYNPALQAGQYPGIVPVIGGVPYPGYASFNGQATFRTFSEGISFTPTADFSFSLLARQHRDFPAPIAGFSGVPQTDVLGQQLTSYYLGQPPYDITGDLRLRVNPHLTVDLQRSYYFNFGNQRWSPQFIIQVSQ